MIFMSARLNPFGTDVGPKFGKYLVSATKTVADTALPVATQNLVTIRASQINGCGGCLDMHTKEAAHAGETSLRLNLVAAWRETTVFTDAERAALELTEQGTRIADGGTVTDDAWADAAKHYDDEQLMALVCLISGINAFNRLNVILQQRGGDYQLGQAG
jgi:AhpD family alkylhydroperoxidase